MNFIKKIKNRSRNFYRLILLGDKFLPEAKRWFLEQSDNSLRLDYDLNENSVVFDVGGYEGSWAAEIYEKFKCNIFIFEPVPEFSKNIEQKFLGNKQVHVYSYGLGNKNNQLLITMGDDNSSFYIHSSKNTISAEVRGFSHELLSGLGVETIDLLKINIEGGEYDLLEHMIDNETISLVKNLQVQFHNFVPNAIKRRNDIRRKLGLTHKETWCYEFVWENWVLNPQL
jgi:FkbM family methyltransferase